MLLPLTSAVTILSLFYCMFLGGAVGRARVKYNVKLPAMAGHLEFEKTVRVHMNTLENLPLFLVGLWLFSWWVNDMAAGIAGAIWLIARILYGWGYKKNITLRLPGFFMALLIQTGLLIGALIAIIRYVWASYAG